MNNWSGIVNLHDVALGGNDNIVFTKRIEYTDFPLDEITLYFANNVIHLPSEY